MEPPNDIKELRMFLGMVNYHAKFLPKLSDQTKNMRLLDKKNACWQWGTNEQSEFDHVKEMLTKAPALAYFDKSKPVTMQCDASMSGLGVAII